MGAELLREQSVFVAVHGGMVGAAIVRRLQAAWLRQHCYR